MGVFILVMLQTIRMRVCIYNNDCNCISPVYGCADTDACNYLSTATISQGCIYSSANGNTSFGCWVCSQTEGDATTGWGDGQGILQDNDINDNGLCDDVEIIGCMDALACNYDPTATAESAFADAGSPCQYLEIAATIVDYTPRRDSNFDFKWYGGFCYSPLQCDQW